MSLVIPFNCGTLDTRLTKCDHINLRTHCLHDDILELSAKKKSGNKFNHAVRHQWSVDVLAQYTY